jgi:hypothetical protein
MRTSKDGERVNARSGHVLIMIHWDSHCSAVLQSVFLDSSSISGASTSGCLGSKGVVNGGRASGTKKSFNITSLMDNEFILAVFNLNTEKELRGTKIPGLKFTLRRRFLFLGQCQSVIYHPRKGEE